MRHTGNIFQSESYRGTGIRTISPVFVVAIFLTVISVVMAVYIVANFGAITANIAIWMANFLSSGFPILITVAVISYFILRLKRRMRRRFWGW